MYAAINMVTWHMDNSVIAVLYRYEVVLLVNHVIGEIVPSLVRLGRVSFYDFKTFIFINKPL